MKNTKKEIEVKGSGLSMLPLIQDKDKVTFISKIDTLQIGDLVIFYSKRKFICHRILEINRSKGVVVTKGDNMRVTDKAMKLNNIVGKVTSITKLGKKIMLNNAFFSLINKYFLLKSILEVHTDKIIRLLSIFLRGRSIFLSIYLFFLKHHKTLPK